MATTDRGRKQNMNRTIPPINTKVDPFDPAINVDNVDISPSKLNIKKYPSINFHEGYLDLKPYYDEKKYARAKDLGSLWQSRVANHVKDKASGVARENFKAYIEEGNKMSYRQLRKLNSVWKKDYATHMIKESDQMKEYMKNSINLVQE